MTKDQEMAKTSVLAQNNLLPKKVETGIPFSGFYETIHMLMIENSIYDGENSYSEMSDEDIERWEKENPDFSWKEAEIEYCKLYVEAFGNLIGVSFSFNEMTSPKEYNYLTDEIYCNILESDVQLLKKRVDPEKIRELVKERHSSYPGFSSFYDNDYDKWLTQDKPFDHNQIETLLECLAIEADGEEWQFNLSQDVEYYG